MQYKKLVELYEVLSITSKRLEKTKLIASFLNDNTNSTEKLPPSIFLLLKGSVFPAWSDEKIGVASSLAVKSLCLSSGASEKDIIDNWKKIGDLGEVATTVLGKKRQATLFQQELTVEKVYLTMQIIATQSGVGSISMKVNRIVELLGMAKSVEAKYIIRTVLEDLRIGVGDSTIRDAIALSCFGQNAEQEIAEENNKKIESVAIKDPKEELKDKVQDKTQDSDKDKIRDALVKDRKNSIIKSLQEAYDVSNDWAIVYALAKQGIDALKSISLSVGKPVKAMLYPKALDINDSFEHLGKPCAFEYKYDGFRLQIHKEKDTITLYTRGLENVTNQFPDIVQAVKENIVTYSCILDAEAVGYDSDSGKYLPFQHISKRIKRKYDIDELVKSVPVEIIIFDILSYEGKSTINEPYLQRRNILQNIIRISPKKISIAEQIVSDSEIVVKLFFDESVAKGNEGIMGKKLDAPYQPGARVGYGMKIKAIKESLDVVIIEADYGEGKRAGWFASFTIACIDQEGNFLTLGKVSTGLKEKREEGTSFEEMTELLKPYVLKETGKSVIVRPLIVIEVAYEELQKSSSYESGYALRFPRFLKLRADKSVEDATSIDYLDTLFRHQK